MSELRLASSRKYNHILARQARSASLLLVQAVLEGHRWASYYSTLLHERETSNSCPRAAAAAAAHAVSLPHIGKAQAETREYVIDPDTQIGVGIDPGVTQAVSAASERWLAPIKPHLPHLAAASSAGTSLVANLEHITVNLATWDAVWEVYLDPKWAIQWLRLYGAQDRALEQSFKQLEEDMTEVSIECHGYAKQLVVFFGAASIGTGAWSQQRDLPVLGLMWCSVVAPRKPSQAQSSSQEATQAAASEPGPSTPPPAKRSKRTKAEQAVQAQGKAAKAKPVPQPGRWLDRDCNAALNMQRIGESKWRLMELCYWADQGALSAKGREYPGLGYKWLRDKPPKAHQQPAEAQRIHLSEGSAACGLGLVCGLLLLATRHYFVQQAVVTHLLAFSADSFFTFLLPPVIFYAGLSLEKKMFFAYLGPILALGIVGTGIAFLLTAAFLWAGFAGFRLLRLQDCLALGAIFSATDSVATLQVLNADTQPLLFSLVFGEGIINDATSVVLLGTINRLFPATAFTTTPLSHTPPSPTTSADRHPLSNASTPAAVWHGQGSEAHSTSFMGTVGGDMLATFLYLFITSLSLGVVTGLGTSYLVTRFAGKGPHHVGASSCLGAERLYDIASAMAAARSPPSKLVDGHARMSAFSCFQCRGCAVVGEQEVAMIGLLSYLSYLVAEVAQLSGILSLFCCAIIISHLALPNLWVQADVAGASTAIAKALNVPACWCS
ncbi:hypothetical protein QJQ45_009245 [Haematococcus lacustris]|nr:hypothetical protein QJQ45_009245 [Haematococcus lacustris]